MIAAKSQSIWRFNNTPLNNTLVKDEVSRDCEKYSELNESGNTSYQTLWDTAKIVLREKLIELNTYIRKEE